METHTSDPCNICGSTETNLVDGFYYCAECGTQDTNVRETVIEYATLGDGVLALGNRKRITQIPQAKEVEMTDDWYRWHSLNFLLKGLADELIEVGASPSFKTKLLWAWTRYMKKYQNRADFGLPTNQESENNEDVEEPVMADKPFSSDEDEEEDGKRQRRSYVSLKQSRDITKISMHLILSFLYVALNLDKSHIQLSHLLRFMREERISIRKWQKLVPEEMRPKKLFRTLFCEYSSLKFEFETVRVISLEIFRRLDLGNPIVPDLRLLIDEYMRELCLPNDLKPLVISLIHHRSFDYLDINVQYKELIRMPSYEIYVMSHIVMALKICFGLDDEYELKVSDAVEKINDLENHPKSYYSEPTERLFSFREWCSYIQFRNVLLKTHTLYLGAPNYFDMDDYVASEHQEEKRDNEKILKDEIAADIINKIPNADLNVIPKNEFVPTTTPHFTYTRVISEHLQDLNVKKLIDEDYTQYSLKYIVEDMFLVDLDAANPKNILKGVSARNIEESKRSFDIEHPALKCQKGMVYVKDCDNHNWMKTQRPHLEHITSENDNVSIEKENDHGYESNSDSLLHLKNTEESVKLNDDDSNITIDDDLSMDIRLGKRSVDAVCDSNSVNIDSEPNDLCNIDKGIELLKITIVNDDDNIFDDDFVDLEKKKEVIEEHEPELYDNDNETSGDINQSFIPNLLQYNKQTQEYYEGDNDSDVSSVDSIHLTPETLNRNDAIKELVLHACHKHKISIPGKYIIRPKQIKSKPYKISKKKDYPRFKGEITLKIKGLVAAYHSHIQHDVLHQMSNLVKSAIANFDETKQDSELPVEFEDPPHVDNDVDNISNGIDTIDNNVDTITNEVDTVEKSVIENILNNTTLEPAQNETAAADDNDKYNLFGDSSDGETHAEELLPKKNPEFDEETHDISQLYLKRAEDPSVPEIELNPKLIKIVDKKIQDDTKNPSLLELSPEQVEDSSDSEEEVSLDLFQEQKQIREQLAKQHYQAKKKLLKRLIQNEDIPPYKYWFRQYLLAFTRKNVFLQRFANELDKNLPKSFVFVLRECAKVAGYPPFNLYKGLESVEEFLKHKYVNRKRLLSSYIEKVKKMGHKRRREF